MTTVIFEVNKAWTEVQVGEADVDLQNRVETYDILYALAATEPAADFKGHLLGPQEIVPRTVLTGENLYVRHDLSETSRPLSVAVTANA